MNKQYNILVYGDQDGSILSFLKKYYCLPSHNISFGIGSTCPLLINGRYVVCKLRIYPVNVSLSNGDENSDGVLIFCSGGVVSDEHKLMCEFFTNNGIEVLFVKMETISHDWCDSCGLCNTCGGVCKNENGRIEKVFKACHRNDTSKILNLEDCFN